LFVAAIAGIGFLPGVGVLVCIEGMFSRELFATENAPLPKKKIDYNSIAQ
jgi:hypothetical protein